MSYYNLKKILKTNAKFKIIIGERSNGKSYSVLERILKIYIENNKQSVYLRNTSEQIQKKNNADTIFKNHIHLLKDTMWDGIEMKSNGYYLYYINESNNKKVFDNEPFCYKMSVDNSTKNAKGGQYPNVGLIFYDEFIERNQSVELEKERFVNFLNMISTVARDRDDVEVFLVANKVNKHSRFFTEFGVTHIETLKEGEIRTYKAGNGDPLVAVEMSGGFAKKSDVYFAFDNIKAKTITNLGTKDGVWEYGDYPILIKDYDTDKEVFKFYIYYEDYILDCVIIQDESETYAYIREHLKYFFINENEDLIFSNNPKNKQNWFLDIKNGPKCIIKFFELLRNDKCYYDSYETGEIFGSYVKFCNSWSYIKK